MGGYTLGGGHSPIGRKFGLAIDNLLEVEMVTANGTLVYATETETTYVDPVTGAKTRSANTDLFWALRGGGGGTFGIVTAFTYKLHPDSPMATVSCSSPLVDDKRNPVDIQFLKDFNDLLSTSLAPEWGGYILMSIGRPPSYQGEIFMILNHFGPIGSASFNTINPFISKHSHMCQTTPVPGFFAYEKNAYDQLYYNSYIFNTLMQPGKFSFNLF